MSKKDEIKMTYHEIERFNCFLNSNGNSEKIRLMAEQAEINMRDAETAAAKYYWAKIQGRLNLVAEVVVDALAVCNKELNKIKKARKAMQ